MGMGTYFLWCYAQVRVDALKYVASVLWQRFAIDVEEHSQEASSIS